MLLWACSPSGQGASETPMPVDLGQMGPLPTVPAVPLVDPEVVLPIVACKSDIAWASNDDKVLIRWSGRAAAGQDPKSPNEEDPPTVSILPGSETAPDLTVERRFGVNGQFETIASGIGRTEDTIQSLKTTEWWNDLASYVADEKNNQSPETNFAPNEISLTDVYEFFDGNVMAASLWADRYHEIALLLGMGHLDSGLANQQQVEYRVSLEIGNNLESLGVTCPITVGEISVLPPDTVTATSNPGAIMGIDDDPFPDIPSDEQWTTQQNYRRQIDQSIYIGWDLSEASSHTSTYNIYRYPVDQNLDPDNGVAVEDSPINSKPISPGGSLQGGFSPGQWEEGIVNSAVGNYDLNSPDQSDDKNPNTSDGYFYVDDSGPAAEVEQSQIYCYEITAIDLLGVESSKSPANNGPENCAAFQDFEPPNSPVGFEAELVVDQVRLKWLTVSDAETYSVYRAEVDAGAPYPRKTIDWLTLEVDPGFVDAGDYTSFNDASISDIPATEQEEKDYWYRVRAWDAGINPSPLSQPVYVFMRDGFPPETPTMEITVAERGDEDSKTSQYDQIDPSGPCIRVEIDGDTDYVQIYRALDDGSMQLVATIPVEVGENWVHWCDSISDMPGSVPVTYIAQAHDSDGNYSWSESAEVIVGSEALFEAPAITSILSEETQPGIVRNTVNWNADMYPDFDVFNVYRFNNDQDVETLILEGNSSPIATVPAGQVQPVGNGYSSGVYKDSGLPVNATLNSDFYYVVSAERFAGGNLGAAAEKMSEPYLAPPGDAGDYLTHALRNVKAAMWCSEHIAAQEGEGNSGVRINWDPEPVTGIVPPAGLKSNQAALEPTCRQGTERDWGAHLVFRSRSEDSGYVQIAPVIGGSIGSNPANPEHSYYATPDVPINLTGGIEYLDKDAAHGTYWYVVVTTDPSTGEPVSVTPPKQITLGPLAELADSGFKNYECQPNDPPRLTSMFAPTELIFGSGEQNESTVTVCKWTLAKELERGIATVDGTGFVTFRHPVDGSEYRVLVTFEGVRSKASGIVLSGTAKGSHDPVLIKGQDRFDYSVANIVVSVDDVVPNGSQADVELRLHESVTIGENNVQRRLLALPNTWLDGTFNFSTILSLTPLPAGSNEILPGDVNWSDGIDYFVLDQLPIAVLTDQLLVSPTSITLPGDAIGRYYERFQARGIRGPIDRIPVGKRVNSNDALLQQTVFNVENFSLKANGLNTDLTSSTGITSVSSVPYLMTLAADQVAIRMENSVIVEGAVTGDGTISIDYLNDDPDNLASLAGTFESLDIGANGFLNGDIKLVNSPVTWLGENGFTVDETFGGAWTAYIPPLITSGLPADPQKLDNPRDNDNSLWDPIAVDPVWIMPGVNAWGDGEVTWNCLGAVFDAEVDLYLRRSGISHVVTASIAGDSISGKLYGYPVEISKAELGFLDSHIVYSTVGMSLRVPYPANFSFSGTVSGFDGACPREITAAAGGTKITADHWNLPLLPSTAVFEAPAPGVTKHLFLNGGVNLPHDYDDAGDEVEWVSMKTRWNPDGTSGGTWFKQSPMVLFNGLHYLVDVQDGVTLSTDVQTNGEKIDFLANHIAEHGNVHDLECLDENACPGWISYSGTLTVPYFGPLLTDQGSEQVILHVFTPIEDDGNEMQCASCTGYIGNSGVRAKQTWISDAGLELDFPLVIAKRTDDGSGFIMTGTEHTSVLPLENENSEIIRFDSSVVIDSNNSGAGFENHSRIFLGLSSVPASVRAIAETIDEVGEESPSETTIDRWLNRSVSDEEKNLDPGDLDLYTGVIDPETGDPTTVAGCQGIIPQIWPDYGELKYPDTYEVINTAAMNLVPVACFDIDAVESALDDADENGTQNIERLLRLGGGVGQALQFGTDSPPPPYKMQFNLVRGNVEFTTNEVGGTDFERFDLGMRVNISEAESQDSEHTFLKTNLLGFSYTKSGDFTILGQNVKADVFGYKITRADFTLVISTGAGNVGVQGGLTYYDGVDISTLTLDDISGVFGFGESVFYVGMNGNGTLNLQDTTASVGAGLLIGRINQSSKPLLQDHGFAELIDKFPEAGGPMTGVYIRGLTDVPIIQDGCALSLNVGGEVEVWFFTGEQTAYGGSLRGFAYGEALCVISARGDVSLSMSKSGVNNQGEDIWEFDGEGWVAGGAGFDCDPGTWGPNWSGRWWNDDWCYQAGAYAAISWNSDEGWDYSLDADYE